MKQRDCSRNQGFVALGDVPEEVWVAGVIVVVMNEDGSFGTRFQAEDLDELPATEVQMDLGKAVAEAWATAQLTSASAE